MEQKWITITRNYSRKEGSEMFSLTKTREIEKESTYFRQRAESYIALYDVEIQVLEEMILMEFVTKEFFNMRKTGIAKQLKALRTQLEKEVESGNLTRELVYMNLFTIDEIQTRVGNLIGEPRELNINIKLSVKPKFPIEPSEDIYDKLVKEDNFETPLKENNTISHDKVEEGDVDGFLK